MFLLVYLVEKQKIEKLYGVETVTLVELEIAAQHNNSCKVMAMNLMELYLKMVVWVLQVVIDGIFIVYLECHLVQKRNKPHSREIKLLQILTDEVAI